MPQRHQRGTGCATGREEGGRAWTSWATDAGRTTLAELRGLLRSVRPGLSGSAFSRSANVDRGKWPLPDRAAAPGDATPPSRPRPGTEGVECWNPNRNAAINTPPEPGGRVQPARPRAAAALPVAARGGRAAPVLPLATLEAQGAYVMW